MPKVAKKAQVPIDEQVALIESKINSHQERITYLNAKRKALLVLKEKVEMEELYKIVKESGKTPAELIEKLKH